MKNHKERWLSGLKRLPAKQEFQKWGARVRIPLSPPSYAPVAQLDRASDYGSEGLRFESLQAHH
jgi:hypothetical protein